ncbi:DUF7344 domain-containing protein [Halorussus ruber]|uniref:DUF7344 domain-containing protein n=1 Tax=Halorussus ruber TaxID=1126238 RepID=UPI001092D387|nr:hypothetical protein [Halorussus ruber]
MEESGFTHPANGEGCDKSADGQAIEREELSTRELDQTFAALTDFRRRMVVRYFRNSQDRVATITDLARYVANRAEDADFEDVVVALHHKGVPSLVTADVIEYDAQTETVRFVGDERIFELLDWADADSGSSSATDDSRAKDHLSDALVADDPVEKDYLVRQALQYIYFDDE